MISIRPSLNGVFGLMVLASTSFLFGAQSPVRVESRSEPVERVRFEPPIEDEVKEADGYPGMETQYQLQVLQAEVQELRGLVEELTYQLERIRSTADDRYLELDSRFQQLDSQVSRGGRPALVDPSLEDDLAEVARGDEDARVGGGQSEKALYETALELIRNRQFELAVTQLQAVITQYPDGDFIANAYYWLGEVHAAKPDPDYERARQALTQVITYFPDDRKVPDAAFKLGKVYHLMGDCARARELLNQVARDYAGKSAATLADNYLKDKVGDCDG
ncbi:MAG: tetratricopeptide repeat protein [Pseudomonadales bacterium]